jgi:predicted glycosyltransferase involved in capsule biosynthesis
MSIIYKTAVCSLVALAIAASFTVCAHENEHEKNEAEEFSFALWGDMPYAKANDAPKIQALIDDINASNVAFTVFDGDIKDGSSRCDDAQYTDAVKRFNSFKKPMVYVPGDNEWTDCHRINNGSYNNLERLNYIRQTMFSSLDSFGQKKMKLEHQGGEYIENTRWTRGNVVFLGLNIPGSNNNFVKPGECISSKSVRTQVECDADNVEYTARALANIDFVKESFQKAKDTNARGLVITMQADPSFDLPETESFNERTLAGYEGFTEFLKVLEEETKNFNGEVVLVHGDVHFYKIDKPLHDQAHLVKNFTRVETFGSPNVHWIKVSVHPESRNLFTFEPMIVPGN